MSFSTVHSRQTAIKITIKVAIAVGAIFVLTITLLPYLWLVITSFKNYGEVFDVPPTLIPKAPTLDVYKGVFTGEQLGRHDPWPLFFANSLTVAGGAALLCTLIASFAGYGFARFTNLKGGTFLLILILVSQMFPGPSLLIPIYAMLRRLTLDNSRLGLLLLYTAFVLPFTTWMSVGTFRNIPQDLEDAARIDGCSRLQAFLRIVLPMSKLGMATTALFAFLLSWSEYPFGLVLLKTQSKHTVAVGLGAFLREFDVFWNEMAAATVMMSLPLVIIFLFVQKFFVRGLTEGALSG
ncbi:MAG: carbohydrate ABC transporter permease [Candidatus Aerophobus sp.]|nr:MAG: carbohydrate ABC transporter permease [Candidatus Aerophobus sp.]